MRDSDEQTSDLGGIRVYGARVNNLKNIDVTIPAKSLTVVTGLSGSGKSSLAFDTIFAEGQRRYMETLSAYARNFMGSVNRADVDKISGLSPVISIDQKTTNNNPRSTVGTVTEIYDFLRLLYARIGEAVSWASGKPMVKYSDEKILSLISERYTGHKIYLTAPVVRNRKGHYHELLDSLRRKGYLYARIDGTITELIAGMKLDRYRNHNIEVVIDKMKVGLMDEERFSQSVRTAFSVGDGLLAIQDVDTGEFSYYSKHLMCPDTGLSYRDPSPHDFSFNSALGACPRCKGLGYINVIDHEKVFPDGRLSVRNGGIAPIGKVTGALIFSQIEALLNEHDYTIDTPLGEISYEVLDEIIGGTDHELRIQRGGSSELFMSYDGLVKYIHQMCDQEMSASAQKWAEQFNTVAQCPECHGARLCKESLHFFIDGKNIHDVSSMDLHSLSNWIKVLPDKLGNVQREIATEIIKEIDKRLHFLLDVGLGYLSLSRQSITLSGGESQRIRLATQIGSQLVNVLYILDEPSIGLHQRDNQRLIEALKQLRDIGNTIIVVEHDKDIMLQADYIVDMGPKAGRLGGNVVYQGTVPNMLKAETLTSQYLSGKLSIPLPPLRRKGSGHAITLAGATGNNLKNITVSFPLGIGICITGVSGSGKSTLISDTLLPILSQHFYRSLQVPLPYERIEGLQYIDKVVKVDQSPIGRIPRSNPATYTGIFSDIRNLFVDLPEAAMKGYKAGRFSFNVSGGRCPTCKGNGYRNVEMGFLPSVFVPCETCHGKRYNRETLEIRFKGKSIADILDMTINHAVSFFENVPHILRKIKVLQDVGLGYLKLGQPSTTLSGGESQRIKLATELSKKDTGKTLYILDEPTTGLHFEDIRVLLEVLHRLIEKGNTIIVIEHNLDVIKMADYIIDMGPEGGAAGGQILATGTPEELACCQNSHTAQFLRKELNL